MSEQDEQRILEHFRQPGDRAAPWGTLFRRTSCAVAYAHGEPDCNGHYGIRELCPICPVSQLNLCASAWRAPNMAEVAEDARRLGAIGAIELTDRAIMVKGLDEPPRYHLRHGYGHQVHDRSKPHHHRRHGRADIGRPTEETPAP
ncbi:hypothetical protein [Streptomyces avicenniae]|uniref:hypothetical protein n=1 Tax=Streptomyces avicenniae TaxID=500153 RepID=UPI000699AAE2|nr:hypothetical protein [Streptomyces avicenniae]